MLLSAVRSENVANEGMKSVLPDQSTRVDRVNHDLAQDEVGGSAER